ncbi:MAG: glycoside hydrolase family 16 protein [Polyangiaceae bacterium]|jgi:beta-glucanase (GH16 family)
MNRRGLLIGFAGVALPQVFCKRPRDETQAASAPLAPVVPPGERGYRLVRNWDFATEIRDIPTLSKEFYTRYIYNDGTLDHLADEWSRYRDNNNHVFTAEGLSLIARATGPLAPGAVESGMLRSRWSGQYGIFEICMRAPRGRGLLPAFWLNAEDQVWPPEIDVVEIVNNESDTTRRSFHYLHGADTANSVRRMSKLSKSQSYDPGFDYADDFHVFGVEWTAEAVRHFVDGVTVCDQTFRWVHNDGRDGGRAHILVNLSVGGHWPGPPDDRTLPASLSVRHVRVWQR